MFGFCLLVLQGTEGNVNDKLSYIVDPIKLIVKSCRNGFLAKNTILNLMPKVWKKQETVHPFAFL